MLNQEYKAPDIEEIRQARKRRILINLITVYGDESHDEQKQRVYAVAGIAGTKEQWDKLESSWKKLTHGIPFHATDCETGYDKYKEKSPEENHKLYADLINLLADNKKMWGFGSAIDIQAIKAYIHDDTDYIFHGWCFQQVVMYFAEKVAKKYPGEKVKFIFHKNSETNPATTELYDWLTKLPEWEYKYSPILHPSIEFIWAEEDIGIQAADLIARETMKYCDNFIVGPTERNMRKSIKTLVDSEKYLFQFFSKNEFEYWENQVKKYEKEIDYNDDEYKAWLSGRKLNDNKVNRIRYMIHIDSLNRIEATKS
jgi:hypothetical protein